MYELMVKINITDMEAANIELTELQQRAFINRVMTLDSNTILVFYINR